MKRNIHFLLIGMAGLVGLGGASVLWGGAMEASAISRSAFARPQFEAEYKGPTLDLTRKWSKERRQDFRQLAADTQVCREALRAVGINYTEARPVKEVVGCGYDQAVSIKGTLSRFDKRSTLSCPLAAQLYSWELEVVAPAAEKYFGSGVSGLEVLGTYSCRKVNESFRLSQHAFGKAIDVAGFKLVDGRKISVLKDYHSEGPEGQFLREIRKKACDMFDVTLGPDFNADHANHFHFDIGGEYACR